MNYLSLCNKNIPNQYAISMENDCIRRLDQRTIQKLASVAFIVRIWCNKTFLRRQCGKCEVWREIKKFRCHIVKYNSLVLPLEPAKIHNDVGQELKYKGIFMWNYCKVFIVLLLELQIILV